MKPPKLLHFITQDKKCTLDEKIAAKLCEASDILRPLVAHIGNSEEVDIYVQFCSAHEFYQFANLYVDLLNECRIQKIAPFREFMPATIMEYLSLAAKFSSKPLKRRCSDGICFIIEIGNLSLGDVGNIFRICKYYHLFFVFTKLVKFLCQYSSMHGDDVTVQEDNKRKVDDKSPTDDEIKNELKSKLSLASTYVVLKLIADFRTNLQHRFRHEFVFENVCKNTDCVSNALYCVKCKFTMCRICGNHYKPTAEADQSDVGTDEPVCYNCKKPFRECICVSDKCSMCSNCGQDEIRCRTSGDCDEIKICLHHWYDFIEKREPD